MNTSKVYAKLFLTVTALVLSITASGQVSYDFTSDNEQGHTLCYSLIDEQPGCVSLVGGLPQATFQGSLVLPDSVEYQGNTYVVARIGAKAFINQYMLFAVILPQHVISIGDSAFYWCFRVSEIEVPESVTGIGTNAFLPVPNIVYGGSATGGPWGALYVNAFLEDSLYFSNASKVSLVGCHRRIATVDIPATVDTIKYRAVAACDNIRSISIPEGVRDIGAGAFLNCYNMTDTLVIPSSVTHIGRYAFSSCSAPALIVRDAPMVIEKNGFDYNQFNTIDLGSSVISIGAESFSNSMNIKEIYIPNSVEYIGRSAFESCVQLRKITLPENLDTIHDRMLRMCERLQEITLPASLSHIGGEAFYGCLRLESITSLNPVPPTALDDSFGYCDPSTPVFVPCNSASAYSSDPIWSFFQNIEEDCESVEQAADAFTHVMPNPASGSVSVICSYRMSRIDVYSTNGSKVMTIDSPGNSVTADISSLPAGTYLMRVYSTNGVANKRLVVK